MTQDLVHTPKQTRSQDTQERVLKALEQLLSERFFEQITIRDLAARTGVSSGTIYRRFKDKEALLPVLYERFDHSISEWAEEFQVSDPRAQAGLGIQVEVVPEFLCPLTYRMVKAFV